MFYISDIWGCIIDFLELNEIDNLKKTCIYINNIEYKKIIDEYEIYEDYNFIDYDILDIFNKKPDNIVKNNITYIIEEKEYGYVYIYDRYISKYYHNNILNDSILILGSSTIFNEEIYNYPFIDFNKIDKYFYNYIDIHSEITNSVYTFISNNNIIDGKYIINDDNIIILHDYYHFHIDTVLMRIIKGDRDSIKTIRKMDFNTSINDDDLIINAIKWKEKIKGYENKLTWLEI